MYNKKIKNGFQSVLKIYFILSALLIFTIFVISKSNFINIDYFTVFLFMIIGLTAIGNIIRELAKRSFSLQMMHWIFILIFFFIAGFTQYISNRFVYSLQVDTSTLNYILIIIIIWMLSYYCGTKVKGEKSNSLANSITKVLYKRVNYSKYFIVTFTLLSLIISVFVISQGGFSSLFSRSTGSSAFHGTTTEGSMLTTYFFRNIVLYTTAFTIIYYNKIRGNYKYLLFIQIICMLIVNPVLGMERFNVAIVYLGIFILLFGKLRFNKKFIVTFLIGFIVIFPLLDLFRYDSIDDLNFDEVRAIIMNLPQGYLSGHYDAFSMVINTVNYVKEYGVTYGYQFLGPLLFFVPRSIWPEKPFGSGYTVRLLQGETFLNVSSPLVAEAYINGALIGVIVVGFLFGKVTSSLDNKYWKKVLLNRSSYSYIEIMYPFLIPMFFFMNRGDLMSTTSFAVSHILVFSLLFFINKTFFSKLK